jgi:enterochelin esterase-like enzyme
VAVTFELVDRPGRLAGVRLVQEIGLPGPLEFIRAGGVWRLSVDLPDVHRMEYLLEIRYRHGDRTTIPDPANPRRVAGAFGDKSVLELDGYEPPKWLDHAHVDSGELSIEVEAPELDAAVEVTVWSPTGLTDGNAAPLLVVHDGPEYARLGCFTQFLGAAIAAGELPPLRAALLGPGDRNVWYSASPAYVEAVARRVLPMLDDIAPATARVGVGVSLGALAMLHVHRSAPDLLDGLFLQSGSFFTPHLDPQESDFSGFATVSQFVAEVHSSRRDARPVPAVLSCGAVEENLANNELMASTLHRLGYPVRMFTVADGHNYTAWRDALDPHLTALVGDIGAA